MKSFRVFLIEARFETEIHKNPHPDTIKAIAKKHGSARFVIDTEDNMHVGSAHHFVHPDLGSEEDHIASGAVHHDKGGFSYWAHAPEHNDKVEHAHLKRLEKHGIKHTATDTQFNEARFETEIHKNPSTQALKNMVEKFPMRYTIDRAGNMYAGHAEHHTHVDLSDYREHHIAGVIYKHHTSGEHQFTAAPIYHRDADKIESHPHIKRLMKAGFKRGNEEEDESGVYESLSNWRKAYGAHNKEEQRAGNKIWKYRWPLAAGITASTVHSFATGSPMMGAINIVNGIQLASKHVARVHEIKKKYDEADKREAEHKEWKLARAKYEQEQAAKKLAKKPRKRKAKPVNEAVREPERAANLLTRIGDRQRKNDKAKGHIDIPRQADHPAKQTKDLKDHIWKGAKLPRAYKSYEQEIPIEQIKNTQREISTSQASKLARDFDEKHPGSHIHVYEAGDDEYHVIDGHHRLYAQKARGAKTIKAKIYYERV